MVKQQFWTDIIFPGKVADLRPTGPQGIILPHGDDAGRSATPVPGTFRFNTASGSVEVFQAGAWETITTSGVTGETNTASNLGSGQGVFAAKVGTDLQFKTLKAGTNINLGVAADSITINAPTVGIGGGTNVGGGEGEVFSGVIGTTMNFNTLTSTNPALTIANNGANQIEFGLTLPPAGEVNTGTSLGTGLHVYKDKLAEALRFKSLLGTADQITLVDAANTITTRIADNPVLPGTGAVTVPKGSVAQEPTATNGMIRYNTETNKLRAVIGGAWQDISTTEGSFLSLAGGTLTGNLTMANGGDIILGTGSALDMSAGGNITMASSATVDGRDVSIDGAILDLINAYGSYGIITRTDDPNAFAFRSITGVGGQISVTNADGVAGNPEIGLADNLVFPGLHGVVVPRGTTAERPAAPLDGTIRFNTTDFVFEAFEDGAWGRLMTSLGGTMSANLDMNENALVNVSLLNGRDPDVDGVLLDQFNSVSANTGVIAKSSDGYVARAIGPSTLKPYQGIVVDGGDGSKNIAIGIDILSMESIPSLSLSDMVIAHDIDEGMNRKTTIGDIVSFVSGSGIGALLDVSGEYGLLTRTGDGPPGSFARRSITAATGVSSRGLSVTNGDGVAGNPEIGIDLGSLPDGIPAEDSTLLMRNSGGENTATTVSGMRGRILHGAFRVSSGSVAVVSGTSKIPFAVGAGDFDPDAIFDNVNDQCTPVSGTYRMSAYLEVGASTTAGRYVVRFRRNGVAEGNMGVIVADGLVNSIIVDDLFIASGTDVFSVEITNETAGASTINSARFFGHRIY